MNRNDQYLAHYGILGMKWGVRRYQNPDGSLTSAGRKRYIAKSSDSSVTKKVKKDLASLSGSEFRKKYGTSSTTYMKRVDRYGDPYMNAPLAKLGKALNKQAEKNEKRYMEKASKKEEREVEKQINKRNTDLFIKSHNYASDRINGEWLEEFNNKWSKVFEGHTDWRDSPKYTEYEKAYTKKASDLMSESLSNNSNAKFTTKLGNTYTARYLEKYGNIVWATQKGWDEHDKKDSGRRKT